MKAEELFAKVEQLLFEENCDSIKMNPRDFTEHFMLNVERKQWEPEVKTSMLKLGIVGYLHGPSGQPPKTISVDKLIESGNIQGIKTYKI